MKYIKLTSYKTGVLVPVYSLRSSESEGTGDFLDLKALADWSKICNLDFIQILPVNDTGEDASPYNALSAFALQPLFCRVQAVPEFLAVPKKLQQEVVVLLDSSTPDLRLQYQSVRNRKLDALRFLFTHCLSTIHTDAVFAEWVKNNSWVVDYAAFMTIKDIHLKAGWRYWAKEYQSGTRERIETVWKQGETADKALFYAWVQYRTEQQFLEASQYIDSLGIMLKGDIPIMMNDDSVDVWSQGKNFITSLRAGAPPDVFSKAGQNWGFPIYDWDYLEAHKYDWWIHRLQHADRFYHAYRIDHVLGFFRIWTLAQEHREGLLGYYKPSIYFTQASLNVAGFDNGRIKWLAEPHIPLQTLQDMFGMRSFEIIGRCFEKMPHEDLYLFKEDILGEKDLLSLPLMDDEIKRLLRLYRDRALIRVDENLYWFGWNYRDCWRWQIMSEAEKKAFEQLVTIHKRESEELWARQGEKLLSFMQKSVPMLACAEDLGAVPDCVPVVLQKLGILGLKIPRWARKWDEPGSPFLAPKEYPYLSVCASSVHDTSTVREWWENGEDRELYWQATGLPGACPSAYDADCAKMVLGSMLDTSSALCVLQIQDFFAMHEPLRVKDAQEERMNIPGTVGGHNWSWRLPCTLAALSADKNFIKTVRNVVEVRHGKKLPKK